jgi:hypothetical protein
MRLAIAVLVLSPASALAQVAVVPSYADLGADRGVLNLDRPPNCNWPVPTYEITTSSGRVVTATTTRSDGGQPWFAGCFAWDQTAVSFHLPNDPATDPGDKRGHYQNGSTVNVVILDFSEPLTGFGTSTLIEAIFDSNLADGFEVYDGPGATGNLLASVTISMTVDQRIYVDFAGAVSPTANIRSARVHSAGNNELYLDALAVAVAPAPACGTSDFNGDGDVGTDADIEAFFACLGGSCCAECYEGGSDFNADGDFGTDADIESFFRVLAGGPC